MVDITPVAAPAFTGSSSREDRGQRLSARAAAKSEPAPEASTRTASSRLVAPSTDQRLQALDNLRQVLADLAEAGIRNVKLAIRVDDASRRFVYELRDRTTDDLLQQFPNEDFLRIAARSRAYAAGLVIDDEA